MKRFIWSILHPFKAAKHRKTLALMKKAICNAIIRFSVLQDCGTFVDITFDEELNVLRKMIAAAISEVLKERDIYPQ